MEYLQPELKCITSSFYFYFKGPLSNKCSEGSVGKELNPLCAATCSIERGIHMGLPALKGFISPLTQRIRTLQCHGVLFLKNKFS